MIGFDKIPNIYIAYGATDLRKGIDGYANVIQNQFQLNPFSDCLFIFCNRQRNKLKCLYWDGYGFWLLYKRLEEGTFKWLKNPDKQTLQLSHQQLTWLLDGLKIEQKTAFKERKYKYV